MGKKLRIGLILGLIMTMMLVSIPMQAASRGNAPDFAPDQILVKFNAGTDPQTVQNVHRKHGGIVIGEVSQLGVQVVRIPEGKVNEKVADYIAENTIAFAEPDYVAQAFVVPNDVYYSNQWGLTKIDAPAAWDDTQGSAAIKIAILDTGIDQNHEDLANKIKIVANKNFALSPTVDDRYGHGTHVAGIAAATANNKKGVAGVGYNSTLMNVKVLNDNGSGSYSAIANGIIWAANNGAKVINMSLGGSSPSTTLESAVNYAWSKGVVIVAAAGNNGSSAASYPAFYENCIAVSATDASDALASWSNYGDWVDVAAPGVNIYSTLPNHSNRIGVRNYGYLSGTSMATPFVAGEAALIWATDYSQNNNAEVRTRLESTADPVSGTGSIYGRINVHNAVNP